MTAQAHDLFVIDDRSYNLVGIKGTKFFEPGDLNLCASGLCTGCWRGYRCLYILKNNMLILNDLGITLVKYTKDRLIWLRKAPQINGISAVKVDDLFYKFLYSGLNIEIKFTGKLLIAEGFIESLYIHMGFHPAWKFKYVMEITFEEGRYVEKRDVSEQIELIREKMKKVPLAPDPFGGGQPIMDWIKSTFDLNYNFI
jgi:hypothetical protein